MNALCVETIARKIGLEYDGCLMLNNFSPIFCHVRDMAFFVRLMPIHDYRLIMRKMLEENRGSCSSKHYYLGMIFQKAGIDIEYHSFPFRWSDLRVDFPRDLKIMADKMPIRYHAALVVNLKGKKFLIDATWDKPLEKAGFPISTIESMKNAIDPCGEAVIHKDIEERIKYLKSVSIPNKDLDFSRRYYTMLNDWCAELRK